MGQQVITEQAGRPRPRGIDQRGQLEGTRDVLECRDVEAAICCYPGFIRRRLAASIGHSLRMTSSLLGSSEATERVPQILMANPILNVLLTTLLTTQAIPSLPHDPHSRRRADASRPNPAQLDSPRRAFLLQHLRAQIILHH